MRGASAGATSAAAHAAAVSAPKSALDACRQPARAPRDGRLKLQASRRPEPPVTREDAGAREFTLSELIGGRGHLGFVTRPRPRPGGRRQAPGARARPRPHPAGSEQCGAAARARRRDGRSARSARSAQAARRAAARRRLLRAAGARRRPRNPRTSSCVRWRALPTTAAHHSVSYTRTRLHATPRRPPPRRGGGCTARRGRGGARVRAGRAGIRGPCGSGWGGLWGRAACAGGARRAHVLFLLRSRCCLLLWRM